MTFAGLGFDPAPGSPDHGHELVARLRRATEALERVDRLLGTAGAARWQGMTAEAFLTLVNSDMAPRIREAHRSFERATRALDRWLADLDAFQTRARGLEWAAQEARATLASARARADEQAIERSERDLADVLHRARDLSTEVGDSAAVTASALETASSAAPDDPGVLADVEAALEGIGEFLGDALVFVSENWRDILHKVVNIGATVLSIASILCPEIALIALIFAVADVAMTAADTVTGRKEARAALGDGIVGLAGGLVVGRVIGAFLKVVGPSLRSGPFRGLVQEAVTAAASRPIADAGSATGGLTFNPSFGPSLAGYIVMRARDARDSEDGVDRMLGGDTYYDRALVDNWLELRADR